MNPYNSENGYAESLEFGKRPLLLVIDMIAAYTQEESPFYAPVYAEVVTKIQELISIVRKNDVPVVFTNLDYDEAHRRGGHFVKKVKGLQLLAEKPHLKEFSKGIEPALDDLIITKQYASCFWGTELRTLLAYGKHDSVLICGVSTSGCVRATATDAIQAGYIPMIAYEAVGDRSEETHHQNLFDLQMKYADLYTHEEIAKKLALNKT
ncbi:MAG: isochorismatase family protein [Cyclobacteriaceae bacterium]|nr:isochorismatase family protein [Cyclobacteriaceae bacterium]MCH8516275.1 isochorismatase family protein [Cyclobacteriaceae bacterium]